MAVTFLLVLVFSACNEETTMSDVTSDKIESSQDKDELVSSFVYSDENQIAAERLALDLVALDEVKEAREILRRDVYAPRISSSETKQALLDPFLDDLTFAAALWSASDDPANPNVTWFQNPPHAIEGQKIPGGRFGMDSPDRVYRYFPVDRAYAYELRGRRSLSSPPSEFFVEACASDKSLGWGLPLRFLYSHEIKYEEDGSFVITIDASPANGRENHLELPEGSGDVLIRDTLIDWANEMPNLVVVRRVGGPEIEPVFRETIIARTPQYIRDQSFFQVEWEDHPVIGITKVSPNGPLNVFVRPTAPGQKAWGVTAPGKFHIADDEAFVLTIEKQTAGYISMALTDPWLVSRDYVGHTSSLNNTQTWANPDNTITFIISKKDPGFRNWLDTVGINEGGILLRLEMFEEEPNPDAILRDIKIVKLGDLDSELPFEMPTVSPKERRAQIDNRRDGYNLRVKTLFPSRTR